MSQSLAKAYSPHDVEARWYAFWLQERLFHADEHSNKEPFCIVIPPPNVTGKLHMGHAIFVTIQDILTRYKKMQGFEALWLPGTDHAGIATQVMVERQLAKEGLSRHALGREAFLRRVWQWKEEKGGNIISQLKVLGAACDWERERFTMDEGLSVAVREAFVRLHREGLIYRDERLVNWDPVAQTVLSDLEVDQEPEAGHLWHIAYPIEGTDRRIVVATTRPETMLGDAAVAVHPDDPRYQDVIGKQCLLPLTGRTIPIIADGVVADPAFGTGAVKITPAHDFNDFACGVRNRLPRIQVIGLDARMTDTAPEAYRGLSREACREAVVRDLEAQGYLVRVEAHTFMPARSQRSGALVEPLLLPQWWVNAEVLAKPAIEAVERGRTRMIPAMWEKTFFNWMHNIRDWCISRQLWWGHQIPAWYCTQCSGKDLHRIHHPGHADAELRIGTGAVPLVDRACPATCPECGGTTFIQDPDVLDTWFSSALWPFSTMGWPESTATLRKFYPTTVMETAADIIFFWVARMMMMGEYFMDEAPFATVYFHALIRDKEGRKMSKTYGNVIDPLHVVYGVTPASVPEDEREACRQLFDDYPEGIEPQGADALRFTLAMYAAQGRDIRLDVRRVEGYRAFINKLWQAARFVAMNLEGTTVSAAGSSAEGTLPFTPAQLSPVDAWILDALQGCVARVTQSLEDFRFNDAAQGIYDFLWSTFCDWYIELAKPILYDQDAAKDAAKTVTRQVLVHVLETVLRLLHPFAPYVSEEIWQSLPKAPGHPRSIMLAPWPKVQEAFKADGRAKPAQQAIAMIQALRNVRGEANIPPGKRIALLHVFTDQEEHRACCDLMGPFIQALAKVSAIAVHPAQAARPTPSATTVADGMELVVPLADLIDFAEEKARLSKALAKLDKELAQVTKKIENPAFVDRAPENVVAAERDKMNALAADRVKLLAGLQRLEKIG